VSNWNRREADTLAEAICKHIRSHPNLTVENELLESVQLEVDAASTTVNTNSAELSRFRSKVCAICRGSSLYECDVDEGWSVDCALIFTNTTQFGDL
jgi:hypothetical protein